MLSTAELSFVCVFSAASDFSFPSVGLSLTILSTIPEKFPLFVRLPRLTAPPLCHIWRGCQKQRVCSCFNGALILFRLVDHSTALHGLSSTASGRCGAHLCWLQTNVATLRQLSASVFVQRCLPQCEQPLSEVKSSGCYGRQWRSDCVRRRTLNFHT